MPIISRTDPRITGGVSQLGGDRPITAPAPTQPLIAKQPVGAPVRGPKPAATPAAAGPGGVPGGRGPRAGGARVDPYTNPKRGAVGSAGFLTRKQSTAPWLRAAQPAGTVIGG